MSSAPFSERINHIRSHVANKNRAELLQRDLDLRHSYCAKGGIQLLFNSPLSFFAVGAVGVGSTSVFRLMCRKKGQYWLIGVWVRKRLHFMWTVMVTI